MHPAKSVILFTTASGAGYGLLAWLALLALIGAMPGSTAFVLVGFGLALGLVTVGLLSSTFHLGHPERAWRALSQWRSSWLSREGVAAVLAYGPAVLLPVALIAGAGRVFTGLLAVLLIGLTVVTVWCTAMIYGSLKTVPAWHGPLTLPGYLIFAAMTGSLPAASLLWLWGAPAAETVSGAAALFCVAGIFVKRAQWQAIDHVPADSTPETATGLGDLGRVRLLEGPHTAPNYLMREMGFEIARRHAVKLRRVALACGFIAPAVLCLLALVTGGTVATLCLLVAVVSGAVGIAVERWLFFAEAAHVVTLYYGGRLDGAAA